MQVTLKQLAGLLPSLLQANIVPYIKGSPAIGKSAIAHTIAAKYKLKVIDIRLAECDPTDIHGFPYFDPQTKKASYFPLDTFPTETDQVPEGYEGWLILLDEFSSASLAVQAAAYKLVLDRQVGQHKLHPKVKMIAAGNLETDNAIVNPMSSALVSRFAHFEAIVSHLEWHEWAASVGVDYRITAFLNFKPDHLYNFNPEACEQPYASPRTWVMLNKVLSKLGNLTETEIPLIASLVDEGVSREFLTYLDLQHELPKFEAIIANPKNIHFKDDLSVKWALMGMIAHRASQSTLEAIGHFFDRFPDELKVVAIREIVQRHPELVGTPEYNTLANRWGKALFG